MDDLSALVNKISSDATFVKELAANPEAALEKHNIKVSADVLKTIKGMDEAGLRELAANYSFDKAAC
jgi:hypothetical protein